MSNEIELKINRRSEDAEPLMPANSIKTLDVSSVENSEFFEHFISKNIPCVIKNITKNWKCNSTWVKNNRINWEYLSINYGDLEAPIANCDKIDYNAQCKTEMKIHDYIQYFQTEKEHSFLYLKDWHLRRLRPDDDIYNVPEIFASDWLNEYAIDNKEDDFMFVYIGPKGSWTPLHADVYNSYSWSVNIIGKKKWIFFPPQEENKLRDNLGNLPLIFVPENNTAIKYFEIIQEQGDAIFVPSGWHHQVENLIDTISINHNWINACNIDYMWTSLLKSLESVECEISDLRDEPDFINQCQIILKSVFGMDCSSFITFVCYIANKRVAQLQGLNTKLFNTFYLGRNHILFDLNKLFCLMENIQKHPLFLNKYITNNAKDNFHLTINKVIKTL